MNIPKRTVKSFARIHGRLTEGQQNAIATLWPLYGVEIQTGVPLDLNQLFGRENNKTLEIGFGNSDSFISQAKANVDNDFLGIEVYLPGVGLALRNIADANLANVKICKQDAMDVVQHCLPDQCLSRIQIFFPDPWPKKKHHKRRLIQPEFVKSLVRVLKPGGELHVATDWQAYAEHTLAVLNEESELTNTSVSADYVPRPDYRPLTKFEQRGIRLGHGVWDIVFTRK